MTPWNLSRHWRAFGSLSLLALPLLVVGCMGALELASDDSQTVLSRQILDIPSPLETGPLAVESLYYGSGTDKNRAEYRDSVAFTTGRVDASKLVSLGSSAKSRNKYWGFKPDSFPLNGRVWYPDGPGPYPLILVAHGNHNMKDFYRPRVRVPGAAPRQPRVHPRLPGYEFHQRGNSERE